MPGLKFIFISKNISGTHMGLKGDWLRWIMATAFLKFANMCKGGRRHLGARKLVWGISVFCDWSCAPHQEEGHSPPAFCENNWEALLIPKVCHYGPQGCLFFILYAYFALFLWKMGQTKKVRGWVPVYETIKYITVLRNISAFTKIHVLIKIENRSNKLNTVKRSTAIFNIQYNGKTSN